MPPLPNQTWATLFPTSQDTIGLQQPNLVNDTFPGANDGHRVLVEHVHALRDKAHALALIVGDDSELPGGSLRSRVSDLEAHAFQDDVSGQFAGLPSKLVLIATDTLLIEDGITGAKKKVPYSVVFGSMPDGQIGFGAPDGLSEISSSKLVWDDFEEILTVAGAVRVDPGAPDTTTLGWGDTVGFYQTATGGIGASVEAAHFLLEEDLFDVVIDDVTKLRVQADKLTLYQIGSDVSPELTHGSFPGSGFHWEDAERIDLSTNGVLRMAINATKLAYFVSQEVNYDQAYNFIFNANAIFSYFHLGGTTAQVYWTTSLGAASTDTNYRFDSDATRSDGYLLKVLNAGTQYFGIRSLGGSLISGPLGALATNATDGFIYVPTSAGPPTGVPVDFTGKSAVEVDTTNDALYFYSSGAWHAAGSGSGTTGTDTEILYGKTVGGYGFDAGLTYDYAASHLLTITLDNATANAVATMLKLVKTTSGAAAAGLGVGMSFDSEDDGGNPTQIGKIDSVWTTTTDGAGEAASMKFYTRNANAMVEHLRLASGQVQMVPAGSDSAPELSHASYPTAGWHWDSAARMDLVLSGALAWLITPSSLIYYTQDAVSFGNDTTVQHHYLGGNSSAGYWDSSLSAGNSGANWRFDTSNLRTAGHVFRVANQANYVASWTYRGHTEFTPYDSTSTAAGALAWDGFRVFASTLTLSGVTGITALAYNTFSVPTVAGSAANISDLDTVLIAGHPTLSGSPTATRRSSLRTGNGQVRFNYNIDNNPILTLNNTFGGGETAYSQIDFQSNSVLKLTVGWNGALLNFYGSATNYLQMQDGSQAEMKNFIIDLKGTQDTSAAGFFRYTPGAHLDVLNVESPDAIWALNRTVNFVNNTTLAAQRVFKILGPTYTGDSATKTITRVALLYVDKAVASTNITITENLSILTEGKVRFLGDQVDWGDGTTADLYGRGYRTADHADPGANGEVAIHMLESGGLSSLRIVYKNSGGTVKKGSVALT